MTTVEILETTMKKEDESMKPLNQFYKGKRNESFSYFRSPYLEYDHCHVHKKGNSEHSGYLSSDDSSDCSVEHMKIDSCDCDQSQHGPYNNFSWTDYIY